MSPFQFARVPDSFLGRSFEPVLPPVGGYSPADLTRMQFNYRNSDPALSQRVGDVMAMRLNDMIPIQEQMLEPPPIKKRGVKQFAKDASAARQSLLDALSQNRQYIEGVDETY